MKKQQAGCHGGEPGGQIGGIGDIQFGAQSTRKDSEGGPEEAQTVAGMCLMLGTIFDEVDDLDDRLRAVLARLDGDTPEMSEDTIGAGGAGYRIAASNLGQRIEQRMSRLKMLVDRLDRAIG